MELNCAVECVGDIWPGTRAKGSHWAVSAMEGRSVSSMEDNPRDVGRKRRREGG